IWSAPAKSRVTFAAEGRLAVAMPPETGLVGGFGSPMNTAPIQVFDLKGGKELAAIDTKGLWPLILSPDSKTLAACSVGLGKPGNWELWDLTTGEKRVTLTTEGLPPAAQVPGRLLFSADGRTAVGPINLTVGGPHTYSGVAVWDTATGQRRAFVPKG